MGIKFHCPNGHKLNVKSFLAGKRGICPHCGIKVQIPNIAAEGGDENAIDFHELGGGTTTAAVGGGTKTLADTVTLPNTFARPAVSQVATTAVVNPTPVAMPAVAVAATAAAAPAFAPVAAVTPVAAAPAMGTPVGAPVMATAVAPMMSPGVATPLSPSTYAVVPAAPVDPIAEAPNAVWYVRPPSGGQFGPARGDVMRKWLGEGRVSADSLVWRDGWGDWKPAATTFPQLAPSGGAPAQAPVAVGAATANPAARVLKAKKRSNSFAVGMVVTLGFLAIGLLVIFILVATGTFNQS
jgi:hypothetical protein